MKFTFILESPKNFKTSESFIEIIERISQLGYDGIELQLEKPDDIDIDKLVNLLDRTGLNLSSFQTGKSYLTEGLCYVHKDKNIRNKTIARMKEFVDFAVCFKAISVTGLLQGLLKDETDSVLANDRIVDCLQQIAAYAQERGATLVLEPCNKMEVGFNNTVEQALAILKRVAIPSLQTMVDTFHANIEEKSVTYAIRKCFPNMSHLHLSESTRGDFGTGHMDFIEIFKTLNELGYKNYCGVGVYFSEENVIQKAENSMKFINAALYIAGIKTKM